MAALPEPDGLYGVFPKGKERGEKRKRMMGEGAGKAKSSSYFLSNTPYRSCEDKGNRNVWI
jgi:hypothetical protein